MDLVKVLSTDTDRKIGEAAEGVAQVAQSASALLSALTTLITNVNAIVVALRSPAQ